MSNASLLRKPNGCSIADTCSVGIPGPFCMAEQNKVDFHGYDFVGLEYIFSMDDRKGTEAVPFYAFYKKIGTAGNGNLIYARTYVPAFAVSGYREYFEKQKEAHA